MYAGENAKAEWPALAFKMGAFEIDDILIVIFGIACHRLVVGYYEEYLSQ